MGVKSKFLRLVKEISVATKQEKITKVLVPTTNDKMLDGKNAIIIGGTGGIGVAIASRLRDSGCNVIITGRDQQKVDKVAEGIGAGARGAALNIGNISEMRERLPEIIKMFDNAKVDILVNSAGLISSTSFLELSEKEWDSVMDANIKGLYFATQIVANDMIKNGVKGHILNISSASSLRPAWGPYQISKWALNGFTKGVADVLLPYGIICNAIAPGPVSTPMMGKNGDDLFNITNPSGRCAAPEEIANLALLMVSSMGDYIVGETYVMSGGGGTISYHK